MKKKEFIKQRGQAAWDRKLEQNRQWQEANLEKQRDLNRRWAAGNPEKVEENSHEQGRKGGKYYPKRLIYNATGLRGERHKVRIKDAKMWRQYKRIIAPDSQLHHSWLPGSAEYDGLALVEANQHRHGIIDVIQVLGGRITVFTEKELRERGNL